jgi:hypothetical protein
VATATKKKKRPQPQGNWKTKAQWKRNEKVGMRPSMSLDDLKLNWVRRRIPDLDFKGAVQDVHVNLTIKGASTITVTLRDPAGKLFGKGAGRLRRSNEKQFKKQPVAIDEGWEALNVPDQIGRAVDLDLDGVVFRLTKVNYRHSTSEYELTFEHRVIYWLRRKGGPYGHPRHASRASSTRAMFIFSLLREIKTMKVPFICPELYTKQRVAAVEEEPEPTDDQTFDKKGKRLTIQGVEATAEQRRNMSEVIRTASETDGAATRSIMAVIVGVIQESWCKNLPGGDADSRGILQVRDATAAGMHINNRSIGACVERFMEKGFWGKGGANELAQDHPNKSPGWIAQQCQGSAYPERYDRWLDEAEEWYEAAKGLDLGESGGTYRKSYQYKRDKDEVSWDCMQRLAEEVNWDLFMVGNSMYFMSEPDLYKRRVRYIVKPNDPAILEFTYDVDWGKPANQATMTVNLDRWGAPPGCVIMVDGFGVPDGRWLVTEIDRGWFSTSAEVTLTQPGKTTPEPASEVMERPGRSEDVSDAGEKLFKACKRISDAGGPYVYGGGHGPPLSSLRGGQGLDCSSSTSLALYKAGLWDDRTTARVSGDFADWGRGGRGEIFTVCYSGEHVYIRFESGMGVDYTRFDTSPWGDNHGSGPRLRTTQGREDDKGMKLRHYPDM